MPAINIIEEGEVRRRQERVSAVATGGLRAPPGPGHGNEDGNVSLDLQEQVDPPLCYTTVVKYSL